MGCGQSAVAFTQTVQTRYGLGSVHAGDEGGSKNTSSQPRDDQIVSSQNGNSENIKTEFRVNNSKKITSDPVNGKQVSSKDNMISEVVETTFSPACTVKMNDCQSNVSLSESERELKVNYPCLRSTGNSKWPIRCYVPFPEFSVNGGNGGCASLVLISTSYGEANGTTSEILLLRSGFDSNHLSSKSICTSKGCHFGSTNYFICNESGRLLIDCLFGTNHAMLISNVFKYGNLQNGVFIPGPVDGKEQTSLFLNVNDFDGGSVLLMCCGRDQSASVASALYMIRYGRKESNYQTSLITGKDSWKIDCDSSGHLHISGVNNSFFTYYLNRETEVSADLGKSKVVQLFPEKDSQDVELLSSLFHHVLVLVLCSHSYGTENSTSAALYALCYDPTGQLTSELVTSCRGSDGPQTTYDWKFSLKQGKLIVNGPPGFCRYAVLATVEEDGEKSLVPQHSEPIKGVVTITKEEVSCVLSSQCVLEIQVNGTMVERLDSSQIVENDGSYIFKTSIKEKLSSPGIYLIRVFAVMNWREGSGSTPIELEGSPQQLITQSPGVLYALNIGAPAFQSLSGIVYSSEHQQFANFSYDYTYGTQCRALGVLKTQTPIPQLLTGTHDGFLYSRYRTPHAEAQDERKIHYTVPDIPNGNYRLRFHCVGSSLKDVRVCGENITNQLAKQFSEKNEVLEGYHAHKMEVPVTVKNNQLEIFTTNQTMCGFALLDSSFKDKEKSVEELAEDEKTRSKLCINVDPIIRSVLRKTMNIVGWSPNLLQNASGEAGNLSHWNVRGDWRIYEGGHGTEKAFQSSHMDCVKRQQVNLGDHFTVDYLDTQPEIQVFEWYKEGSGGGGFYILTVTLLDEAGNEIKRYSTGKIGSIYKDHQWQEASVTFSQYGTGVRRVTIETTGKDDKYWAGHYGTIVSASVIRVKRDVKKTEGDDFVDITMDSTAGSAVREKLISKILSDNKKLLQNNGSKDSDIPLLAQTKMVITNGATVKNRNVRRQREIRVFVSSTFRDMHREREGLIKKTFKELNNLCSERGVFFTYVDLRWGITSEQTSDGQTIAICLQEIERCHPYFICMLGERFGWSQTEESPDHLLDNSFNYAVENFPSMAWIDNYRYNTSVTQLEVTHGVLNRQQKAKDRSYFYLRSPVQSEVLGIPEDTVHNYHSESDWHHDKVYQLRQTIIDSGLNTRNYQLPEDVCALIKQDLVKCIETDFPQGSEPTPLEREREAHAAFADVRQRVYIGRQEYFEKIEEHFSSHKAHPLVVLGESGSGKSSLIANWTKQMEDKDPETFVFMHFIGSSAESASYLKLIRRLIEEIKDYFQLDMVIPSADKNLIQDLPKWLSVAGRKEKCIIVLDALNQLDDGTGEEGGEHDLLWIPATLPHNVYMLLSTLPGRTYEAVNAAGWPSFKVNPLDSTEKEEIITGYLSNIYRKTLNSEQKELIVNTPQTSNPLYLRVLLDEVRMYGSFGTLTAKIKYYLSASSPANLFLLILQRLEEDFEKTGENPRAGLVKETTTAIWCSNRGMSESELIDLLQINSMTWSPFYLSLVESLVNRNGILNFFHDHLRQAVEKRYLSTTEEKREGYLRLADYFTDTPLNDRKVVELPFLLAKSGELQRLRSTISDLEVFKKLISTEDGKFDLIKCWKLLGDFKEAEDAYLSKIEEIPEEKKSTKWYQDLLTELARFFLELGLLSASRHVLQGLLVEMEVIYNESHCCIVYDHCHFSWRRCCNHPDVLNVLQRLGTVCEKQKDLDEAEKYYKEAISRQNRIQSPAEELRLCEGLLGLAEVFSLKKDMKRAQKLYVRSQELATHILGPRHHYVATIISKIGQLCYKQTRVTEALSFYLEDLKLTRGDVGTAHPITAGILNDVGLVYDDQNDPLAGRIFETSLMILLDTYGPNHVNVAVVRYNLGAFYFATNYFARAKFQFTEAYKIFLKFLGLDHADTVAAKEAIEAS